MAIVRQRTLPSPTSGPEFAYKPVLDSFVQVTSQLIGEARAERLDLTVVKELAEAASLASERLFARWERLEPESPYRSVGLEIPIERLEELIEIAQEKPELTDALDVDAELADLLSLRTRQRIASDLRRAIEREELSIRSLAKRSGFSAGHLSDIRNARSGLPTELVCQRLDKALGTKLGTHIEAFAARAEELRERSRRRRRVRKKVIRKSSGLLPADTAKLRAMNATLAGDRDLLDLVEALSSLPASTRRGIHAMVRELRED